ncbi:hypothetical protein TRAPUB_7500 [Trametes pubescens]|uniref:Uncharacterized protein n=1 Tax=Trametes pubescens TaxID=154538 RepID=A0A1M2V3B4_TRAPU|nr:hypothetical protein TRAPUB_7500 [Trametes pubescens]
MFGSAATEDAGALGELALPWWLVGTSEPTFESSSHERYAGGSRPDAERARGMTTPASVWRRPLLSEPTGTGLDRSLHEEGACLCWGDNAWDDG